MSEQQLDPHTYECARHFLAACIWEDGQTDPVSWDCLDLPTLRAHGVIPLVWDYLQRQPDPIDAGSSLEHEAQREAVFEGLRKNELMPLLDSLNQNSISYVLFKGSALAYSVYPRPVLRPRVDHDLLIRKDDYAQIRLLLNAQGFQEKPTLQGQEARGQAIFYKHGPFGECQLLDVHWELSERKTIGMPAEELFSQVRMYQSEELRFTSFHPTLSLLVACVHLRNHHPNEKRLLWYVDLAFLLKQMSQSEREEFESIAQRYGAVRYCVEALGEMVYFLEAPHCVLPPGMKSQILDHSTKGRLPERYKWQHALSDIRGQRGLRRKLKFVFHHLFPPLDYMRHRYGVSNRAILPFMYGYRLAKGIVFLLRKTG